MKGGGRVLTGHVSFFDRTANIDELVHVLPRLAAVVKVMEITAQVGLAANHTYKDFSVRRLKVQAEFAWLCAHSPAYIGVTISVENLELIPADGQIEATVIQVDEDPAEDCDIGPAAAQRDPAVAPAPYAPPQHDPLGIRPYCRQLGAEVSVHPVEALVVPRPARITAVVAGAAGAATALVQVIYLDDGSIADGIPLERVFVDVETDHTGVVDAGDARAHAAARDARFGLANLAQAAQLPTAAAARAFLGA